LAVPAVRLFVAGLIPAFWRLVSNGRLFYAMAGQARGIISDTFGQLGRGVIEIP
jgi:hypothetical protein